MAAYRQGNDLMKRLSRRLACSGTILDFYRDTVELPDGHTEEWDFVRHKRGGGAAALPVLPDGRILLIRQYRQAIGEETLELPAGTRDSEDEPPELTARRELLEETGYTAGPGRMVRLAHLRTAVAYCSETVDVFLAENVTKAGSQHLDEAEEISFAPYTLEDLLQRIDTGEICDAKTVAGILAYAARRAACSSGAVPGEDSHACDVDGALEKDADDTGTPGTGNRADRAAEDKT